MVKRTKTQRKRIAVSMQKAALNLFLEGLINEKQYATVRRLSDSCLNKLK
tara:strand:+ start:475 stop:624 length:150 start_codon:yes stop_codon:yes gene_type:complete